MTCLVAYRHPKYGTCVGADGRWVGGHEFGTVTEGKMFRHGRFVVALAGSIRTMQVIRYNTPLFNHEVADENLVKHLVQDWTPALQKSLDETGQIMKDDKTIDSPVEGLIVTKKRIIRLSSDFSILEEDKRYAAAGAGDDLALGAIQVLNKRKESREMGPYTICKMALEASAAHNTSVGPPYTIWEVK